MDSVNVFVVNGAETFGLLVQFGSTYVHLVGMIANQLKIDTKHFSVNIEYTADVNMPPIRIMDDSSLHFYLELKRKDPRLTAYALRINLTQLFQSTTTSVAPICGEQNVVQTNSLYGLRFPNADLSILNPDTHDFISSIEVSALEIEYDRCDEITAVTIQPDMECVRENRIFRDKSLLKNAVSLYAIRNNFQYKVYKSDNKEYVLKCLMDNCDWKLRASKIGDTDMFKIRYIKSIHTCSLDNVIRDHRLANSDLIGELVKHKYTSARTIYTPVDIMNDMAEMYGVTMKYGKAWRAREHALEAIMGDPDQAYNKLPLFMRELEDKNPGSITGIEIDSYGQFKYAFMALAACIQGWRFCKPVVVVDAKFLTGRYRGSLFTACTQDANNGIFVLAFGIRDSENNDSWSWFLRRFKEAFGERNELCFVSPPSKAFCTNCVLFHLHQKHFVYCLMLNSNIIHPEEVSKTCS